MISGLETDATLAAAAKTRSGSLTDPDVANAGRCLRPLSRWLRVARYPALPSIEDLGDVARVERACRLESACKLQKSVTRSLNEALRHLRGRLEPRIDKVEEIAVPQRRMPREIDVAVDQRMVGIEAEIGFHGKRDAGGLGEVPAGRLAACRDDGIEDRRLRRMAAGADTSVPVTLSHDPAHSSTR